MTKIFIKKNMLIKFSIQCNTFQSIKDNTVDLIVKNYKQIHLMKNYI